MRLIEFEGPCNFQCKHTLQAIATGCTVLVLLLVLVLLAVKA